MVQQNGVYLAIDVARGWAVADHEGGNGLDFRSAGDPRVRSSVVGPGPDGVTLAYDVSKYGSMSAPIVLASGTEARLIEAESALGAGDAVGALGRLNALRSTVAGLSVIVARSTDRSGFINVEIGFM